MILEIIVGFVAIYGLWFYIQGKQTIEPEVRKTLPPQDIEDFNEEKAFQKHIGQLILLIVSFYLIYHLTI